MNKQHVLFFIALVLGIAFLSGCDFGVNPLIFDTTIAARALRVDTTATVFIAGDTLDLQEVRNAVKDEIDSVKFYNLTIRVDSTAGTPAGVTLRGAIAINDGGTVHTLATLDGVPLSAFAKEVSIFDKSLWPKWAYDNGGVGYMLTVLRRPNPPTVTIAAVGTSSTAPLHFTVHAKVYAQIFTKPKNK